MSIESLQKNLDGLRKASFMATLVVLWTAVVLSSGAFYAAMLHDKEAICQHIRPEARTLSCDSDHEEKD